MQGLHRAENHGRGKTAGDPGRDCCDGRLLTADCCDTWSLRNISPLVVVPRFEQYRGEIELRPRRRRREEKLRPSTSPLRELMSKRDFYAGGLMVLLGLGIALKGTSYRAGTLMHMGPGFLPTALGVLLVFLGIAIAAAGLSASADEDQ